MFHGGRSRIFVCTPNSCAAIKILLKWKMCAQTIGIGAEDRTPHLADAEETIQHGLNWMGRLCPYDLWFDTFEYGQKIDAWAFLKEHMA